MNAAVPLIRRRLAAQRDLSRVLASGREIRPTSKLILDALSGPLDCVVSELWRVDETRDMLCCVAAWSKGPQYGPFTQTSEGSEFGRGVGLPGRVWASGAPQWIVNAGDDPHFARKLQANACGIHAAVAFPVAARGKVCGVVQFFYDRVREPDAEAMELFGDVGEQIGLFFERARADAILLEQAKELVELSAPVLKVGPRALLVPIVGTLDARRADRLMDRLLEAVVRASAHTVVLDVTGAGVIDTYMAQRILDTVAGLRLLGARAILTGVQPNAARTLALLGINLADVDVCATLADGLAAIAR
jgi:anti-anti-sigma regulatory factor